MGLGPRARRSWAGLATVVAALTGGVADPAWGAAPGLAPVVTRVETVATDAQVAEDPPGSPGDPWGGQQSRIIRLSTGELLAVYLSSPAGITDPSQAQRVLMRRGPAATDRWVAVARAGRGDPRRLAAARGQFDAVQRRGDRPGRAALPGGVGR